MTNKEANTMTTNTDINISNTHRQDNEEMKSVTIEEYMKQRGLTGSKLNDMSKEELILFIADLIEDFGEIEGCAQEAEAAYWLYTDINEAPKSECNPRRKSNIKHAFWNLLEKITDTKLIAEQKTNNLIDLCHPCLVRHDQ